MGKLTDCFKSRKPGRFNAYTSGSVNGSVNGDDRAPLITRPTRARPPKFMSFSCSKHPITIHWSCLDTIEFLTPQALANRKLRPAQKKDAFLGFGETGWNYIGALVTALAMFPQGMFGWLIVDKLLLSYIPNDYAIARVLLGAVVGFASWKGKKDLIRMFNTFQFIGLAHYNFENSFINPKNFSLNGLVDFIFVLTSALTFAGLSVVAMSSDDPANPGISELLARFGDPVTGLLSVLFGHKFVIGLMAGSSFWSNSIGGQGLVHLATRFYMRLASPVILKTYDHFQGTHRYSDARHEYYNIEAARQHVLNNRTQFDGENILRIGDVDLTAATLGRWHPFSEINAGEMNDPATELNHYKLQALFRTTPTDALASKEAYEGKWYHRGAQMVALGVAFAYSYWGFENFSPLGLIGLNACAWLFGASPHVDTTIGDIFGRLSFAFLFYIMSFGIIGHDVLKLANMLMGREMPIFTLPRKAYIGATIKAGAIALGGGAPNACQDFIVYDVRGPKAINQAVAADLASAFMEFSALVALRLNPKRESIYLNALDQHLAARRDAVMIKALNDLFEDISTNGGKLHTAFFSFIFLLFNRNPRRLEQTQRSHYEENVLTPGSPAKSKESKRSTYYGLTYLWFTPPKRLSVETQSRSRLSDTALLLLDNTGEEAEELDTTGENFQSIKSHLKSIPALRR